MKKQLILGSFLAMASLANAQWTQTGADMWNGTSPSTGNVGVGGAPYTPSFTGPRKFQVFPQGLDNGIEVITPSTAGNHDALLLLNNQAPQGHSYWITSCGTGHSPNIPGALNIWDGTANAPRMTIAADGNVGFGSMAPGLAKILVNGPFTPYGASVKFNGVKADCYSTGAIPGSGAYHYAVGVEGNANSAVSGEGWGTGVQGTSDAFAQNIGGDFYASGVTTACGWDQFGVRAIVNTSGGAVNQGIYAEAAGGCYANWAGYFNGDVWATGSYWGSDRRLKDNIKPLSNTLDKIMLLKPSSYIFKTDEFKSIHLPAGDQLGLIAQELETVFPQLIKTTAEHKMQGVKGETIKFPELKSVNYIGLIPVLISGIQEQQAQIEDQTKSNNELKTMVGAQQKQIDELKALVNSLAGNTTKTGNATAVPVQLSDKNAIVLNQNVPNPFAESTVISYNIPSDFTKAQIIFTTLAGKVIKAVTVTEKGAGTLNVFGNDLTNGTYTYTLVVDGKNIDTKKMIKE